MRDGGLKYWMAKLKLSSLDAVTIEEGSCARLGPKFSSWSDKEGDCRLGAKL